MSISKRFAEGLGGGILVRSQPGQGSVFTVRVQTGPLQGVPLIDDVAGQALVREKRKQTRQPTTLKLKPGRILLVDDGDSNREFLTVILEGYGLTVEPAVNGQVAVEKATAEPYDLILMDMQMPIMDGYAATRGELHRLGVATPVIALTANALVETSKKCSAAGCNGFLAKPVNIEQLNEVLMTYLEGDDASVEKRQRARQFRPATPHLGRQASSQPQASQTVAGHSEAVNPSPQSFAGDVRCEYPGKRIRSSLADQDPRLLPIMRSSRNACRTGWRRCVMLGSQATSRNSRS